MERVLNNVEVLKLTQKLKDVGEDLFVVQIPRNLDMSTSPYRAIPEKLKFYVSQGKEYFKTIGEVATENLEKINAEQIFDNFLGIYDQSYKYLTKHELIENFNKLLK